MSAADLRIQDLCAGYGPTLVLEGIDLTLPAGGRLAVLGRNGMGKTTLLASIAGQTRQRAGSVVMAGLDLGPLDGTARARAGLAYVPQHRAVFRSLTVEENLRAGLMGRPRAALAEAWALFPRLHERRHHPGGQLSGGEQQMLAIARGILGRPRLLLLDEPLEGLAPLISAEVMAAVSGLAATGQCSVILVEQRLSAALEFADQVVVLDRGRIAWAGSPAALQGDPVARARLLGLAG